ncbi:unnamed protein product [Acanthoscelides obtectus]|uniref:Reverse transcriptase domain-containing protein n=1 Tax=Acanthoscelides obtectus TaxID=200917 RepID=A0A9P0MEB6_ACAOB|nr:unnamed protein product [Acanthoscelides obtectus]CAK1665447.1 Probable RNA-directed DNA polymerase from transposon X-element [Acanthoscelides obtectus]
MSFCSVLCAAKPKIETHPFSICLISFIPVTIPTANNKQLLIRKQLASIHFTNKLSSKVRKRTSSSTIINSCIKRSYFPKSWKLACVLPLAKVNSPSEFGQLRSILLLPTLSKPLEKAIAIQVANYVFAHNIIPPRESGFRTGYSCSTALTDLVDDVIRERDAGNATVLVLLDYTKTFDMINHEILVAILKYIGLEQPAYASINSFLSERMQRRHPFRVSTFSFILTPAANGEVHKSSPATKKEVFPRLELNFPGKLSSPEQMFIFSSDPEAFYPQPLQATQTKDHRF